MAIISSYPYDVTIQDNDAWIGTDSINRQTKQYTANSIAKYLNINGKLSVGGQMVYGFSSVPLGGTGTFSLPNGGGSSAFSAINSIKISILEKSGQNVVPFISYLVGSEILINAQDEAGSFGHYGITSYIVDPDNSGFYIMGLSYIGGNGNITSDKLYDIVNFTKSTTAEVEAVNSGLGINITGTTKQPVVNIDYSGSNNFIEIAPEITSVDPTIYSPELLVSKSNPGEPVSEVKKIKVSNITLDKLGNPSSSISLNNFNINNLAAPINDDQAVNRGYLNSALTGYVQSVTGGDGVSVTGSSATPAVAVDYSAGVDNLIQSATATTNISVDSNFGPYILKSEDNPSVANGVVEKIRLNDISLSSFDSPTYNLSLNNKKITLLGSPSTSTDAANKAYVDSETSLRVQSVTGGNGISVTGSSTTPTVAVDYSEGADNLIQAATATNNVALGTVGDYILKSKSNPYGTNQAVEKIRLSDITLSAFASPTLDFSFGSKKITNLNSPSSSTDAANKAYVDAAIVGGLFYQGGYNASTNTPVIDTSGTLSITSLGSGGGPLTGTFPATTTSGSGSGMTIYVQLNSAGNITTARVVDRGSGYTVGSTVSVADAISGHTGSYFTIQNIPLASVKKGFTYTVTADGTFFGEQLRIGDVLIAESNDPSSIDDWTTVQNNIDIASATQVGIGNVVAGDAASVAYSNGTATVSVEDSTASNKGAVIVSPGEAMNVAYSNGTATVSVEDSTASNKGAVIVAGGTNISVAYVNGTATVTNTYTSPTSSASGSIAAGQTSATVTHNFGTKNVVVLTTKASGDQVYCDVYKTTNTVVVSINSGASQGSAVSIKVYKIT
jgi:hypothetical protein